MGRPLTGHEAYGGVTCDHLYRDCPSLQRSLRSGKAQRDGAAWLGMLLAGTVDPLGTDVCGMCRHRWQRKET